MKKILLLLGLMIAVTMGYSQGSQKIKGTSSSVGVDTAAQKKMQADWEKYITDTLFKKETVKEFVDWFDTHLSNKDYQTEFAQKFLPYYNLWIQSKYGEWVSKRSKKE